MQSPNQAQKSEKNNITLQIYDHHSMRAAGWAALAGALLVGLLYAILPEQFRFGPSWVPLVVEIVVAIPIMFSLLTKRTLTLRFHRTLTLTMLGLVTAILATGIISLIVALPGIQNGRAILEPAVLLWCANILVFSLWYWEIDGGGPVKRHKSGHKAADFMFPQQVDGNTTGWVPLYVDYLFLAFTGATALSPADTYPLTRSAKGLMMVEAILSMLIIVLLVGRAVNIV
jgi:uncharacterized membrane protein